MTIQTIDRGTAGNPSDTFKVGEAFDTCQANDQYLDGRISQLNILNVANLRLTTPIISNQIFSTSGYYSLGDGGGAIYYYDSADVVSADNGATVIVTSSGARLKLNTTQPYNIKQFGIKGDGTDERTKLQAYFDSSILAGKSHIDIGALTISVSGPVYIRPQAQTTSSDVGSDIHFMPEMPRPRFYSSGNGRIKSTSAATATLQFSTLTPGGLGSYANFYVVVDGIFIDGNSLSDVGILIDSAMHVEITRCIITGVKNCITNTGYGVHKIHRNVMRGTENCISYVGGGDSFFEDNDIYIATNKIGIKIRPFGGSTLIDRNTFTPLDVSIADPNCVAVQLAAYEAGDDVKSMGAVVVSNNCFDGMRWGVQTKGFSTANRNVKGIDIYGNYIGNASTVVTTGLAYIENSANVLIHHNRIGISYDESIVRNFVYCIGSYAVKIDNNTVIKTNNEPIVFDNCDTCDVMSNHIESGGLALGASGAYVTLKNGTFRVSVRNNEFIQVFAGGAGVGVDEQDTSTANFADHNRFSGAFMALIYHYKKVGASSVFRSRIYQAAAPGGGTWLAGATNERPAPAAGTFMYDICTTGGTPGTWKTAGAITP